MKQLYERAKGIYHFGLAFIGALIYRHPARSLFVIGITGTKGKSTTVELLAAIFGAAGYKVATLSTVQVRVGDIIEKNQTGNTMPGRFYMQKFLRRAADAGCHYAIIELTSQGISQHRHRFIDFYIAAVTNLHPEHIEAHGSYEAYRAAKVSFFRYAASHPHDGKINFFVNENMPDANFFLESVKGKQVVRYSRQGFVQHELNGDPKILIDWFASDFNMENAALATAIARSQGVATEVIIKAFNLFEGVPGRLEPVTWPNGPTVYIDYAHTPDSLKALYGFLRSRARMLIGVFGSAGGGRDKWKRQKFGEVAAHYCDEIILTSEDPYNEDPLEIARQIAVGIGDKKPFKIIANRKEAICEAIKQARPGDIVAVTGMGSQVFFYGPKGEKLPWSERAIVDACLEAKSRGLL